MTNIAIENGHRNSGISPWKKVDLCIVMLVHQRVSTGGKTHRKIRALALAVQQPPQQKIIKRPKVGTLEMMEGNIETSDPGNTLLRGIVFGTPGWGKQQGFVTTNINKAIQWIKGIILESGVASSAFCLGLWVSPKFDSKVGWKWPAKV